MAITLSEPYIQQLNPEWYRNTVTALDMLRLDALHPIVQGNKWYKLKHNIAYALAEGYTTVLTFGGGYSNHLVATAAAAQMHGLKSIGIVRGERHDTPTLQQCAALGMQMVYVDRATYDRKEDADYLQELSTQYPHSYIIPEGGNNALGRKGTQDIATLVPAHYTHVCLSVGTGTTFTGIRNMLPAAVNVWGYVPMKGGSYLAVDIEHNLFQHANWQLFDDWHFGGFGKVKQELLAFMNNFYNTNNIPLDVVYTGKMMFGIQQQLNEGFFPGDASILCIHTGGLQGNASVQDKLLYLPQ